MNIWFFKRIRIVSKFKHFISSFFLFHVYLYIKFEKKIKYLWSFKNYFLFNFFLQDSNLTSFLLLSGSPRDYHFILLNSMGWDQKFMLQFLIILVYIYNTTISASYDLDEKKVYYFEGLVVLFQQSFWLPNYWWTIKN